MLCISVKDWRTVWSFLSHVLIVWLILLMHRFLFFKFSCCCCCPCPDESRVGGIQDLFSVGLRGSCVVKLHSILFLFISDHVIIVCVLSIIVNLLLKNTDMYYVVSFFSFFFN